MKYRVSVFIGVNPLIDKWSAKTWKPIVTTKYLAGFEAGKVVSDIPSVGFIIIRHSEAFSNSHIIFAISLDQTMSSADLEKSFLIEMHTPLIMNKIINSKLSVNRKVKKDTIFVAYMQRKC